MYYLTLLFVVINMYVFNIIYGADNSMASSKRILTKYEVDGIAEMIGMVNEGISFAHTTKVQLSRDRMVPLLNENMKIIYQSNLTSLEKIMGIYKQVEDITLGKRGLILSDTEASSLRELLFLVLSLKKLISESVRMSESFKHTGNTCDVCSLDFAIIALNTKK